MVVLVDAHPRHAWVRWAVPIRLRQELAKIHVEVNEEKSKTVDLDRGEGFGFLGFDFRRIRGKRGAWRPNFAPKLKKRTALLATLRHVFRGRRSQPIQWVVDQINPILRGWVNYFKVGHSSQCFGYVKDWVEKKITCSAPGTGGASAGRGGVGNGCTTRWGCSTTTTSGTSRRKLRPVDRSHNPCREARRGAECGKSACSVGSGA